MFTFQIAAEVSAPLAKTDSIVMLGDDRTTSELSRLLTNLPPAVQALTGVDLSKVSVWCLLCHVIVMATRCSTSIAASLQSRTSSNVRNTEVCGTCRHHQVLSTLHYWDIGDGPTVTPTRPHPAPPCPAPPHPQGVHPTSLDSSLDF